MRNMNGNWYKLRWNILNRDKFTCQYCGQKAPDVILHVDHKVSRADGGSDDESNLITACSSCNIGKHLETVGIPNLGRPSIRTTFRNYVNFEQQVMNYLATSPEGATGTEIAKSLGCQRSEVSRLLSKSTSLNKRRAGTSVFYSLAK